MPMITEESGPELQKVVAKLKKAPRVVDALNAKGSATGYGADMGDDIFDDFDAPKKKQEVKAEPKVELDIDPTCLLI